MSKPARTAALPPSIRLCEHEDVNHYTGPVSDLLACGLMSQSEMPAEGKRSIAWLHERPAGKGNHRMDETYRRIIVHRDGTATLRVGLRAEERERRRREYDARRRERAQEDARKEAQQETLRAKHAAEDVRRHALAIAGVGPYADGPGQTMGQRIANIESLCRYALVAIQLKKGNSAKLARAEEDLTCAIDDLARMRWEHRDPMAEVMALMGQRFASNYVKSATRSKPRKEEDEDD
jgi:hypothetical protein